MADRITCAALADAVYGDHESDNINHELSIPSDWTQIQDDWDNNGTTDDKYYETNSGFAGAAYKNGNEIVISFRGTEPTTAEDLWADLQIGLGQVPDQFYDALDFYYKVKAANPTANITITGHSLGGALAQLVGAIAEDMNNSNFEITHYIETYAFNPPAVSHLLSSIRNIAYNYLAMVYPERLDEILQLTAQTIIIQQFIIT